jgi:integrase
MPARQNGSTYFTARGAGIRWYEDGERKQRSGFRNKSEARQWWNSEVAPRLSAGLPSHDLSLREHVERYLTVHNGAKRTKDKLREDLGFPEKPPSNPRERDHKSAADVFGDRRLRELEHARGEVAAWVAQLPPSQRARRLRALRQILNAAVDWDLMLRNPASGVKTRAARAPEVEHFADTAEVDLVADEIGAPWSALVVLATETGLRPEEWCALERRDLDLRAKVVVVQRGYTVAGGLKPYGKTSRSRRSVPLTDRALEALDSLAPRIDTPLLFFTHRYGGVRGAAVHLNLGNWRKRLWLPALRGANLQRAGALWRPAPYAMRHTFATWALDAGIDVYDLARLMGTSVQMIDRTYGHLARGQADRARDRLNRRPSISLGEADADAIPDV